MTPRRSDSVSLSEARRIVLAAQGFGQPPPAKANGKRQLLRVIERLGLLQIDSVNVLVRAHTLPPFSRVGAYRMEDLHALTYGGRKRALFEYWGHEASILPVALQPMLRWRMARAARGEGIYAQIAKFGRERRALIADVRREIAERGPLAAGELPYKQKGAGGWWGWSKGKSALEWLFWTGEITTATRRATFERVYDMTERALPPAIIDTATPDEADAQRHLVRVAARACGIASERRLRDYFRLRPADAKPRIAELVESGDLIPTQIEGSPALAYLSRGAKLPRHVGGATLLAPFDPLIWQRDWAELLFGARIRVELYTPREKRTHGYYVLPFLLGEHIVARVDLKADRGSSTLRVLAAHREPGAAQLDLEPLAGALHRMAAWLGLKRVAACKSGDIAQPLARALRA